MALSGRFNPLLTIGELAEYLQVAEKTILRMVHKDEIPSIKIGNQWRFSKNMIDDWLLTKMHVGNDENTRFTTREIDLIPFSRLTAPEMISTGIKAATKSEILEQLVGLIPAETTISDNRTIHEKLIQRESLASTGIGNGIALPHVRNPKEIRSKKPVIIIGLCPTGTDYEALDGGKTYVFFMPVSDSEIVHLRLMAKISKLIKKEALVEKMLSTPHSLDIYKLIIQEENNELVNSI